MCGHIFTIQSTIEDLLETEDIEKLMRMTSVEVDDTTHKGTMLKQLRVVLSKSKQRTSNSPVNAESEPATASETDAHEETGMGGAFGHTFRFRKYLRALRDGSKWSELQNRSLCHKCGEPPEDPWVTSCMHLYCKECLNHMSYDAAKRNQDSVACKACSTLYTGASECSGLEELGFMEKTTPSQMEDSPRRQRQRLENPDKPLRWMEMSGTLLPSAKTLAVKAQVLNWIAESPKEKIIIFSQFHSMIQILSRICTDEGWDYCQYHGRMTHEARVRAIETFAEEESKIILIASLKCGGIGLNLTMASRVICVDLWWNSSVEQQGEATDSLTCCCEMANIEPAFCRIFRIGQERKTHIQRFVVKNSIDTDIRKMQERKKIDIERALGDDGRGKDKLTIDDLLRLFGTVETDDDGHPYIKEFIWPDEGDAAAPESPEVVEVDDD